MTVNARWMTLRGQQVLSITGLGGPHLILSPGQVQELSAELALALVTKPPIAPRDDKD